MTLQGTLWVGTSNIAIPGAKTTFPPEFQDKTRLQYHAAIFNSLEVNATFYKLPQGKTLAKWAEEVPENFRFTLKLSQSVTHAPNLEYNGDDIKRFMDVADHIGRKRGCLLIQFPGSIRPDLLHQVENILSDIRYLDPDAHWRLAVEFRHPSWYNPDTIAMLEDHRAALVLHDMPKSRVIDPNPEGEFVYWRFHGPVGDYRGSYDDSVLQNAAVPIKSWLAQGKDVYLYFNNTIGDAFHNAQTLRRFIDV